MRRLWLVGSICLVVGLLAGFGLARSGIGSDPTVGYCSECKKIAPLVASGSAADTAKAVREIQILREVDAQAGRTGMHLCPSPWHE